MDPQSEKIPGLALPQPSAEQNGPAFGMPQGAEMPAEATPLRPEFMSGVPQAAAQPVQAMMPTPAAVPLPSPQMPATDMTSTSLPASDDNSDALDQEWVNKAKAIVEQTKTDPYMESQELGKVKADYLRIRFNKQIKVTEDQQ